MPPGRLINLPIQLCASKMGVQLCAAFFEQCSLILAAYPLTLGGNWGEKRKHFYSTQLLDAFPIKGGDERDAGVLAERRDVRKGLPSLGSGWGGRADAGAGTDVV